MRLNILFNGALVVDVWRHERGQVCSLGHDVDGPNAVKAKARAARVMSERLQQRGDETSELDAKLQTALSTIDSEPARANEALTELVYAMGERLCPPGEDVLDVEIGKPKVTN